MSIRLKILVACLSLTLVTVFLGTFSQRSQKELGGVAIRIYDDAFMALSYLRAAQNRLMKVSIRYATLETERASSGTVVLDKEKALLAAAIPDILGDLGVAQKRAMSEAGARSTADLRERIKLLDATAKSVTSGKLQSDLEDVQTRFDTAVEVYAGDGYRFRRSVEASISQALTQTWIAVGLSVLVAFVITYMLTRSIIPALRDAVRIARSIANGHLDNKIDTRGSSETSQMLSAVSTMQTSIAANMNQIKALMESQALDHAGEIATQNGRFEAALNSMMQGLCLFDASNRLIVFNRHFCEMFSTPQIGMIVEEIDIDLELRALPEQGRSRSFSHEMKDGRVIAVTQNPVGNGGCCVTYEDITERHRVEATFAHMARHDALTSLPNRVLFHEHMAGLLPRLHRDRGLAVLSLDLDGFKTVNDTLGHAMGDALLREVAIRLRKCTRQIDLIARLGGDEFAIIQEDISHPGDIVALAQRVVDAMATPFEIDFHHIIIGASVGVSTTSDVSVPFTSDTADILLKNADLALYRAKGDGRSTYRFFEPEMDARLLERRRMELDLRGALEKNQFELFYQPLVNTQLQEVCGFEALLRWRHPERGMVSPAEFIPLAEEVGLIRSIGAWVLNQACMEAVKWPDTIKVAVNLSPAQFHNNNLVAIVSSALIASGLPARRLELEITESLLLQDNGPVLETLRQLQTLGASISMDDFGTGYSSLSYLQKFPFDKLKIDQSFVRDISERPDCVAIVRAVISLGKSLGMAVIAEGVETRKQLQILQDEGCWEVQGYLFSPPKPAAYALDLITSCKELDGGQSEQSSALPRAIRR